MTHASFTPLLPSSHSTPLFPLFDFQGPAGGPRDLRLSPGRWCRAAAVAQLLPLTNQAGGGVGQVQREELPRRLRMRHVRRGDVRAPATRRSAHAHARSTFPWATYLYKYIFCVCVRIYSHTPYPTRTDHRARQSLSLYVPCFAHRRRRWSSADPPPMDPPRRELRHLHPPHLHTPRQPGRLLRGYDDQKPCAPPYRNMRSGAGTGSEATWTAGPHT